MFRRSGPSTLGEYARLGYSLLRDVKPETLRQYTIVADLFERWAGGPVPLDQLDEASVSAWLRDYAADHAPATVRAKKVQLLAMWRAAADDGLAEEPSARRVRRVRVPAQVVTAWTRQEVEQLLAAAAGLKRRHRCGLSRAAWWDLAIRVGWDSGLRWNDLVALRVDAVRPDGACTVVQGKTGRPVTFRLSQTTLEALAASLEACPRALVCPWPASHETFNAQVRLLVKKAAVRAGTWKWIRRGSGSDVEAQVDGGGHRHLGNTRAVFDRSYGDQSIIGRRTPGPRELLVEALRSSGRRAVDQKCQRPPGAAPGAARAARATRSS